MIDQILDLVKNKDTNLIYAWDTFSTVSLNLRRKNQVNKQMFWDTNQKFKKKGSVLFWKSHGLLFDH